MPAIVLTIYTDNDAMQGPEGLVFVLDDVVEHLRVYGEIPRDYVLRDVNGNKTGTIHTTPKRLEDG